MAAWSSEVGLCRVPLNILTFTRRPLVATSCKNQNQRKQTLLLFGEMSALHKESAAGKKRKVSREDVKGALPRCNHWGTIATFLPDCRGCLILTRQLMSLTCHLTF